jgi:hypothetical protein
MSKSVTRKTFVLVVSILFLGSIFFAQVCIQTVKSQTPSYEKETYSVPTNDGFSITLIRYVGDKRPSLMLVPGICGNHRYFDWMRTIH